MGVLRFTKFKNDGFGWACLNCAVPADEDESDTGRSRLMREGESESKNPTLSSTALAKWADRDERILECPRCGAREKAIQ